MTQYKFDMKIGHYVVINEGEVPAENQKSQEQNQTQEKATLKNLLRIQKFLKYIQNVNISPEVHFYVAIKLNCLILM